MRRASFDRAWMCPEAPWRRRLFTSLYLALASLLDDDSTTARIDLGGQRISASCAYVRVLLASNKTCLHVNAPSQPCHVPGPALLALFSLADVQVFSMWSTFIFKMSLGYMHSACQRTLRPQIFFSNMYSNGSQCQEATFAVTTQKAIHTSSLYISVVNKHVKRLGSHKSSKSFVKYPPRVPSWRKRVSR